MISGDSGKLDGQHFTPDLIKIYIINEIKPKYNEILYEPAAGTGGFIHHAVKYIKDNLLKNNENNNKIDIFKNNLFANECNPEVYKSLYINMIMRDINLTNIKKNNSLDYYNNCKHLINKIDIICTNPPFGAADDIDLNNDINNEVKNYYKNIL
jgi:type I restriction enzyme M protein